MKIIEEFVIALASDDIPVEIARVGHVKMLALEEMYCVEYLDGKKWKRGPMMPWAEAEANFFRRVEEDPR